MYTGNTRDQTTDKYENKYTSLQYFQHRETPQLNRARRSSPSSTQRNINETSTLNNRSTSKSNESIY